SYPNVSGAYDLILNNFGPDTYNGSIHIEVPDTLTASEIDEMIREMTVDVLRKHHVLLTAVGVYSLNTGNDEAAQMMKRVKEAVMAHEYVLQIHGFYVNMEKKTMRFDVIVSFDAPDRRAVYREILNEIQAMYPDYTLAIVLDTDFSES
ncbi:MAG: cation transporter, partial [Firmicutes bacterium]|nr:cation transporter [Bacillota bacterium]